MAGEGIFAVVEQAAPVVVVHALQKTLEAAVQVFRGQVEDAEGLLRPLESLTIQMEGPTADPADALRLLQMSGATFGLMEGAVPFVDGVL